MQVQWDENNNYPCSGDWGCNDYLALVHYTEAEHRLNASLHPWDLYGIVSQKMLKSALNCKVYRRADTIMDLINPIREQHRLFFCSNSPHTFSLSTL